MLEAQGGVALALGAGGVYGYAHIGVLSVIEEFGLRPDFVVGCSIGAVIGTLYGSGLSGEQLLELGMGLRRNHLLDLRPTRMGLIGGQRLEGVIRLLTRDRRLETMAPPLAIVATDVERGEKVVFTRGPAARAARASSAMPGIFAPVRIGDRLLVDGAVLERVPVRTARELGAQQVVAVGLGMLAPGQTRRVRNAFDVLMQSFDIMQREISGAFDVADVLIEPPVTAANASAAGGAQRLIESGRAAALAQIEALQAILRKKEMAGRG